MARQLYAVAAHTDPIAGLAAGSTLFSLRWADAGYSFRLLKLRMGVACTASPGSYQDFEIFVARSYTATDTGGVPITTFTRRSLDGQITSRIGDMRIADGAAITPGTRTLEAHPWTIFAADFPDKGTPNMPWPPQTISWEAPVAQVAELTSRPGEGVALAQDEGIVITVGKAYTPGLSITLWVQMDWTETPLVT